MLVLGVWTILLQVVVRLYILHILPLYPSANISFGDKRIDNHGLTRE